MYTTTTTSLAQAIGQLTVGALFYGMRSCEYSKVTGERKTEILRIRDLRFFQGRREITKSEDMHIEHITSLTIDFRKTKNGDKEASITMHRTKHDLCPVKAWGNIVTRILNYNSTTMDTSVNYVEINGKPTYVTAKDVTTMIKLTVTYIGHLTLGFGPDDVGTHSIRSSFAMFLYLSSIRSDKIMLQGRWKSLAFLSYIRPQVQEFSAGLSNAMISAENFFHVPEAIHNITETHIMTNPNGPYLRTELDASLLPLHGPGYDQGITHLQTTGRFDQFIWN